MNRTNHYLLLADGRKFRSYCFYAGFNQYWTEWDIKNKRYMLLKSDNTRWCGCPVYREIAYYDEHGDLVYESFN